MRDRKSSLHLRAEPPWPSSRGTLPVPDYLTGMMGAASTPLCPVSSRQETPRGPLWLRGRWRGCQEGWAAAFTSKRLRSHANEKEKPTKEKMMENFNKWVTRETCLSSLCVTVSKHPSLGKLTFLLTASLTVLWKSNYPIKLTLAKLRRTGIKTISDCRIEAWVMCLAHWTCGSSASRAGNILGRRLLFIFWRWTHSRRRSPKDAFFSPRGSKGMRFLLSALSLCEVAVHIAEQQLSAAALSGWRLWAEVTSEQERALLCGVPCPCGAGWGGSLSSLSQLSPLHALGLHGCEMLTQRPLDLSRRSVGPGVKRTGFQ